MNTIANNMLTNALDELSKILLTIDELKEKLTSSEYLSIMTKLGNVHRSLDTLKKGEENNVSGTETHNVPDTEYVDIEAEIELINSQNRQRFEIDTFARWQNAVETFAETHHMPPEFVNSKFNLTREIDPTTIYNCSCSARETVHNCSGNVLHCRNIQHFLLQYPLLITIILSDKYDSNILVEEYNKFFKLDLTGNLNRERGIPVDAILAGIDRDKVTSHLLIFTKLHTKSCNYGIIKDVCIMLIASLILNKFYLIITRSPNIGIVTAFADKLKELFDIESLEGEELEKRKKRISKYENTLDMFNVPRDTLERCSNNLSAKIEELGIMA